MAEAPPSAADSSVRIPCGFTLRHCARPTFNELIRAPPCPSESGKGVRQLSQDPCLLSSSYRDGTARAPKLAASVRTSSSHHSVERLNCPNAVNRWLSLPPLDTSIGDVVVRMELSDVRVRG